MPRTLDSGCWNPVLTVELGFWIPVVIGIPDSLSRIFDSKAHDSGFHKQKFSLIPESWG